MTIVTRLEMWGPKEAELALTANTDNRAIRRAHVENLVRAIRNGEWRITHQGMAFDINGRFIDGQHRAKAILLSGVKVAVMVTRGLPADAFMVMDQGARRSNADILSCPPRIMEVANLAARIATGTHSGKISSFVAEKYLDVIEEPLTTLLSEAPKVTRYLSSAGIKLSAVLQMLAGGDQQYIVNLYSNLVYLEIDKLPVVAQSLVSQVMSGTAKARANGSAHDVIARGIIVFDESCKNYKKLQVKDPRNALAWAKNVLAKAYSEKHESELDSFLEESECPTTDAPASRTGLEQLAVR